MRLTITLGPARGGTMTVRVEHALAYSAPDVARRIADAVGRELGRDQDDPQAGAEEPPAGLEDQHTGIEVPEPGAAGRPSAGPGPRETGDARVRAARWRALRLLDRDGLTVEQAAARVGVGADVVARWDDDAATDAHTDLLVDPHEWARRGRAS